VWANYFICGYGLSLCWLEYLVSASFVLMPRKSMNIVMVNLTPIEGHSSELYYAICYFFPCNFLRMKL